MTHGVTVPTELRVRILDDEGDEAALERGSIQLSQELGELGVDSDGAAGRRGTGQVSGQAHWRLLGRCWFLCTVHRALLMSLILGRCAAG